MIAPRYFNDSCMCHWLLKQVNTFYKPPV
jgi:hypothetical protein